jgi:hypothetical protein
MTASSYQAKTRLAPRDYQRLKRLAQQCKVPVTQIVRDAVLEFLARSDQAHKDEIEGVYSKQLKGSTNRICSLLAKLAIDNRAVYLFLNEIDASGELMRSCRAQACKLIRVPPDEEEQTVERVVENHVARENPGNT